MLVVTPGGEKSLPTQGDLEGLLRSASPSLQVRCKSAPYIGDIADARWIQAYDLINFKLLTIKK